MSHAGSVHVHSSASSHGRIVTENPDLLDLLREKSADFNKCEVSDSHTGHRQPETEEQTDVRVVSHYSQNSDTSYSKQQLKRQDTNRTDPSYSQKQLKRQESNQSAKQSYPEPVKGDQSPQTGRRGGAEVETPRHSSSSVYAVANPEILAAQGITPTAGQQNVKFTPRTERSVRTQDSARTGNATPVKESARQSFDNPVDSLEDPRDSLEEPRDKNSNTNAGVPRDSLDSPEETRVDRNSRKASRHSAVSFKQSKEYIDQSDQEDIETSRTARDADKLIQERVPTPHPSSPHRGSKVVQSPQVQEWDDTQSEEKTPVNSDNDTPQPAQQVTERPLSTPVDSRRLQSPPSLEQVQYKAPSSRGSKKKHPPSSGTHKSSHHSRESRKQHTPSSDSRRRRPPSTPVPESRGRRPLSSPVVEDRKSVHTGNSLPTVKRVYVESPTFTREEEDEFRIVESRLEDNKEDAIEDKLKELEKTDSRKRSRMTDSDKRRFTRADDSNYERENQMPNNRGRSDDHQGNRYDDQEYRTKDSHYNRQNPRDDRYDDRNQHGRYDDRHDQERYEELNDRNRRYEDRNSHGRYEDRNEYGRYEDRNERDRYDRNEPDRYDRRDDRNRYDDRQGRDSFKQNGERYDDRRERGQYDDRHEHDRYDDRGHYANDRDRPDERNRYYDDRQRYDDRRSYEDDRGRYADDRGRYTDDRGRSTEDKGRYTEDMGRSTEDRGRYTDDRGRYDDDRGHYNNDRGRYDDSRNVGDRYDERYDRYGDGNDRMDDDDYRDSRPNVYQNGYGPDEDEDKHLIRQERDYQENLRMRLENEAKKDKEMLIPKLPLEEALEDPWNNLPPPPPENQQIPFVYDEKETARMEVVNPPPVRYNYVENNKVDYGKIPDKSYSFLQERRKEEEEKLEHVFITPRLPPKGKKGGNRRINEAASTPQDDYPQSENTSMAEALWAKRSAVLSKKKDSRASTGMKSKTASGTSLKKNRGLQKYPSEPGLQQQPQYRSYQAPQMYGTPTRNNYLEPMEQKPPPPPPPMQPQNPALRPNAFKRPLDLKPVTQQIVTEDGQRISLDINLKLISPPPGPGQKLSPRQIQADVHGPQLDQGGPRPVGAQYNYQDYGQNYGQPGPDQYNDYYQQQQELPPPEPYHFDYGQKENQPPQPQQVYEPQISPRLTQGQVNHMDTEPVSQTRYTAHHNQQPQPQEYNTSPTNPYSKVPPILPSFIDDPGPIRVEMDGYAAMHRKMKVKEKEEQWYQTYTLKDFKTLQKEMAAASRGPGLGPDLDSLTYKEKLEKRYKQFEYARTVMEKNRQELMEKRHAPRRRIEKPPPSEEYQRRKAAIEYAKNVPKPVIKSKPTEYNSYEVSSQLSPIARTGRGSPGKSPKQVEVINLQKLQQRHEEEKKNVSTIKQNLGTIPQRA